MWTTRPNAATVRNVPGNHPRGPTATALETALRHARTAGRITPEDVALVAACRASAKLVDRAMTGDNLWVAEAAVRETLRELQLTPATRPTDPATDPLHQALLAFMAEPDEPFPDAPQPAAPRPAAS
jgi:hypothetical protein